MFLIDAPVGAAYHLVVSLTTLLHPTFGTAATGVAIVVFTLVVRSLLLPLSISQARAEKVRARLQPKVQAIQKTHRADPERQREEILKLHRAEGASVAGGCLPALAQWPFFAVMYRLFVSTSVAGQQNVLLVHTLLGQNLPGVLAVYGVFALPTFGFVGLLGLLAGLATWSSRRAAGGNVLVRLLPYGTVVMAVFVPMAAGLYLLTTTAWTVGERLLLRRDPAMVA